MNKLRTLKQWSMSVEEYKQKMKLLMIRVGIKEEPRNTIDRIFNGLDPDVILKLSYYLIMI